MSSKPTLTISTPKTANFPPIPPPPSELRSAVSLPSAVSLTPLSAISRTSAFRDPIPSSGLPSAGLPSAGPFSALPSAGPFSATVKFEQDLQKTPITPPVAYLDFLRGMSLVSPALASPPQTGKAILNRTATGSSTLSNNSSSSSDSADSDDSEKEKGEQIDSGPSTARSEVSCQCGDDAKEKTKSPRPAPIDVKLSHTLRGSSNCPLSAPAAAAGAAAFPSSKLPASPSISIQGIYSPRSPLSAASVRSPFDWEAALRSRRLAETPGSKRPAAPETPTTTGAPGNTSSPNPHKHQKRDSRSSIRHIREVVTRTVTYTPRMAPAPKGKRRKIDPEEATAKS
ncbi:hypothetical protein QBC35DRAFT_431523 [Podospora australis]|uniref:Uncharacterized protein n=1 Tax=Podospora australis TaxID=1536484 RepID=A0AAN6WV91_9PEZI|nr:hypothetical protein QBC35DRAFT_431523 [Podospora australis]